MALAAMANLRAAATYSVLKQSRQATFWLQDTIENEVRKFFLEEMDYR